MGNENISYLEKNGIPTKFKIGDSFILERTGVIYTIKKELTLDKKKKDPVYLFDHEPKFLEHKEKKIEVLPMGLKESDIIEYLRHKIFTYQKPKT